MYYWWNGWWWWFAWLIPMFVLLWAVFGFGGRRYRGWGYGGRYRDARYDWDGPWMPGPVSRGHKHRNVGPLNYHRADNRIAEDVSDRLMMDDEIDPSSMEVQVENGEVILTGSVSTRFEKSLAEQIADSVAGVTDVQNRLSIGKSNAPRRPHSPTGAPAE